MNRSLIKEELVFEKENLPKGWVKTEIGFVIDPSKDRFDPIANKNKTFIGLEHIESNTGKIIGEGESKNLTSTKTIFKSGDVLYGRLRPYLNKVCVPNFDGVCSTDILVFKKNSFLSNKFIALFFTTDCFVIYANTNMTGVQHPRINFKKISVFQIPLPPLPEQKRIISKIESIFAQIDAGREKLDNVKKLLKQNKQSVLKYVFEGKLTEQWRDKNKSNLELVLKKIELGRKNQNKKLQNIKYDKIENPYTITEKWIWVKIGIISKELQYGTSEKATTIKSKIPVLRMGNIQNGELNFDNLKYYSDNWKNYEQFSLSDGDVLFNRTNSAELVGKTAIYKDCYPSAVFAGYLIRVKIICDAYIPSLLSYYINSIFGKSYINSVVTQQVGQANVNSTKLSMMPLPLMSFEEQKYIISKIESIFGRIDADFIKIKIMGLIYNHLII